MSGKLIGFAALALVGALGAFSTFFTVGQREAAVVTTWGAFSHVAGPGLHFKLPVVNKARFFDVSQQEVGADDAEAFTVDNQMVKVDFRILYQIPEGNVERIFREVPDYQLRLRTLATDRMKIAFGRRNISEVPQQRGQIALEVRDVLRTEADRLLALEVIDFQIVELEYSPAFRSAVDRAAVAKADVEKAQQEKRQAEVAAETLQVQAKAQAAQQIERARGEAESQRLAAQAAAENRRLSASAEADAIRMKGEAEATAIKAQAEALQSQANPKALVDYLQANKWNGALPQQMLGTTPVPFLQLDQTAK